MDTNSSSSSAPLHHCTQTDQRLTFCFFPCVGKHIKTQGSSSCSELQVEHHHHHHPHYLHTHHQPPVPRPSNLKTLANAHLSQVSRTRLSHTPHRIRSSQSLVAHDPAYFLPLANAIQFLTRLEGYTQSQAIMCRIEQHHFACGNVLEYRYSVHTKPCNENCPRYECTIEPRWFTTRCTDRSHCQ